MSRLQTLLLFLTVAVLSAIGAALSTGCSTTEPVPVSGPIEVLSVTSADPASGVQIIVTGTPDIDNLGNGTTPFTRGYGFGDNVTLTAPATATAGGNGFASWTGCDSTSGTPPTICSVTMKADRTVAANFHAPGTNVLTVNSADPASGVQITVNPTDTNNLGNGTTQFIRTYNPGTMVTLTATATAGGNGFASWTGCDSTSGTPPMTCSVTMNGDRSLTANYKPPNPSACPLNGQYAFLFQGWNSPTDRTTDVAIAGSFTVQTDGTVTGFEDINSPTNLGIAATQITASSSCAPGASNNQGILTLHTQAGTTDTYHFTADEASSAQKGELIEFDSTTSTRGSGFFQMQTTSAFSFASLAPNMAFGLTGDFGANGSRVAAVGRFALASDGTLSNGQIDLSKQVTGAGITTGKKQLVTGSTLNANSSNIDSNGRGTATLVVDTIPFHFFTSTTAATPLKFAYYVIASDKVVMVETDPRSSTVPVFSGLARRQGFPPQTGHFDNTSLNGNLVFSMRGHLLPDVNFNVSPNVAIGQIVVPDPSKMLSGTLVGTLDQNSAGSINPPGAVNAGFTGGYGVDLDGLGRTTLSFISSDNPTVTASEVAYLTGTNEGFIMDAPPTTNGNPDPAKTAQPDINFGTFAFQPQLLMISTTPLSGTFRVNSGSPPTPGSKNENGLASPDTSGHFNLTLDISDATAGTSTQSFTGTYTVNASAVSSNGRGTAAITNNTTGQSQSLVFWIIILPTLTSPGEFVCITETSGDMNPVLLDFLQ